MIFFGLIRVMILDNLQAIDVGGCMTVHMFGAYYGLTVSFFYNRKKANEDKTG